MFLINILLTSSRLYWKLLLWFSKVFLHECRDTLIVILTNVSAIVGVKGVFMMLS